MILRRSPIVRQATSFEIAKKTSPPEATSKTIFLSVFSYRLLVFCFFGKVATVTLIILRGACSLGSTVVVIKRLSPLTLLSYNPSFVFFSVVQKSDNNADKHRRSARPKHPTLSVRYRDIVESNHTIRLSILEE